MNSTKKRIASTGIAASALILGSLAIPGVASSASATPTPRCNTVFWVKAERFGSPSYATIGTTVGKRNGGSSTSTLKYEFKTERERSTTWQNGGGLSIDFVIGKIEGSTHYNVTKSFKRGVKVTDTLKVGPGKRGYVTPMVEYRRFDVNEWVTDESCRSYVHKRYGIFKAITAAPYFAECVSRNPCTPKP